MVEIKERLASVETTVTHIGHDITEMKATQAEMRGDIKLLLGADNRFRGATALGSRLLSIAALLLAGVSLAFNVFKWGFHF